MLKIHEQTNETGDLEGSYLRGANDELELVTPAGAFALPVHVLDGVMARYGAPFDEAAEIIVVAELQLPDGRRLRHVRHLAGYDVVPRDYLVLERLDDEALCAHGAAVVGPLSHLARVVAKARAGEQG